MLTARRIDCIVPAHYLLINGFLRSFLFERARRCGSVELGHELAVGGAGGGKVVVAVLELEFQVDDLLFEGGDPGLELFGVVGASDAGLAPDLFAQDLAECLCHILFPQVTASCCWVVIGLPFG